MNSMADVLQAHLKRTGGNVMALNSGSHIGGNASKAKSVADRAKNRKYIIDTMLRLERAITISDVAWSGKVPDKSKLEISVARRELQSLVDCNLVSTTQGYGGNLLYELMPPEIITKPWRKTEPDLSYQPKYF